MGVLLMAIITEEALARIGAWIEKNILKDDCSILGESRTRRPGGGFTSTWPSVAETKCAVLSSGDPAEQAVAAQTAGNITKLILLPRGTNILGNNKIQVGETIYHVIDVFEPSSYEVCRRVLVRRTSLTGGR
jgi:hypothetical protein